MSKEEDFNWEEHGLMSDEELKRIDDNMKNTEEEGLKNILKYFDRIHDKIFSFNNILIGGYFFLAKFEEEVSFYTLLVPLLNLSFIIYIEYRMMEKSRVQSNILNLPLEEIKKNNQAQNNTNLYSLAIIVTTFVVTIIFLFNLFNLSSPKNTNDVSEEIELNKTSPIVDTNLIDSVIQIQNIAIDSVASEMDINNVQRRITELEVFFGESNIRKDMIETTSDSTGSLFVNDAQYYKIRVTYIPTGEFTIGDSSENSTINLLQALEQLKSKIKK